MGSTFPSISTSPISAFAADSFRSAVASWEAALPKKAWPVYFLSNHDRMRHIGRYGTRDEARTIGRAQVAAMLLLTVRGTPFLYYGEEIGMRNLSIRKKDLRDPVGIRYWPIPVGRDSARTPMQWDVSTSAGFSSASSTWLPVNPDYRTVNVAAQADDRSSLFSFYRNVIWKRKQSAALTRGSIEVLRETPRGILAYLREYRDERCLVVLNFSDSAVNFTPGGGRLTPGRARVARPGFQSPRRGRQPSVRHVAYRAPRGHGVFGGEMNGCSFLLTSPRDSDNTLWRFLL